MANVSHATLTGSEVHEPKGIAGASLGTVYVSNGAGSGSWSSVGTSAFTGMIADFAAPVAPSGWLELDGSIISTTTYAGLYGVMSITTSGTRTNGLPTVTGIADTSQMKAGYYVFGTGIASGTTILSVDSAVQITLSGNASSSGSSAFAVSPFLLNTGTIKLPDMTTAGRYRRSRTVGSKVGDTQADQNKSHNHGGATGTESADHTHTYSGTTGVMSANASHTHGSIPRNNTNTSGQYTFAAGPVNTYFGDYAGTTASTNTDHTHTYSGTTSGKSATHTHTISSDGSSEARPLTLVVMTCIKT